MITIIITLYFLVKGIRDIETLGSKRKRGETSISKEFWYNKGIVYTPMLMDFVFG